MTEQEQRIYIDSLRELSKVKPVWPPCDNVLQAGRKLDVTHSLNWIAAYFTNTARPWTAEWPYEVFPSVVKREGSDASRHRIFRESIDTPTADITDTPPFRWMVQEEVPALRDHGEIRAYVVGGRFHSFVITAWSEESESWAVTSGQHLCSLARMK